MGEFCPLHQGHLDLIMRAKKENDRCVVVLLNYGKPDARLPFARRAQLIREFFMNDRQVQVVAVPMSYWAQPIVLRSTSGERFLPKSAIFRTVRQPHLPYMLPIPAMLNRSGSWEKMSF